MKLSAKCRYAIRILIDLARYYDQGPEYVSSISQRQNVSVKYIEQLIIPLKRAGFIKSVRGKNGGHMLMKKPSEITLGQVVKVLDYQNKPENCYCNEEKCLNESTCGLRNSWEKAAMRFYEELDGVTIDELIGECCE